MVDATHELLMTKDWLALDDRVRGIEARFGCFHHHAEL